mgnify:CR=1 FL=1|jgi:AAA15 family ATPase/GTPase
MFKSIEINNFRGINTLKIDELSRINVFVGPNNSGKTTIIESLFILTGMSNPRLSLNVNAFRDVLHSEENDFRLNFRGLNFDNKIYLSGFVEKDGRRSLEITPIYSKGMLRNAPDKKNDSTTNSDISDASGFSDSSGHNDAIGLNYNFKKSQKKYLSKLIFEKNQMEVILSKNYKETLNARFFSANTMSGTIADRIDKIQRNKKKDLLIQTLKRIEPRIVDVALSKNKMVYVDIGIEQMIPLNLMGYGFSKACGLIANLLVLQDGFLMIDEIENGFHPETLSILWNAIFSAAQEYNVQIFLTTHSYEAIKTLLSVIQDNDFNKDELGLFLIQKFKDERHKCYKYEYESLKETLDSNVEIRGKLID